MTTYVRPPGDFDELVEPFPEDVRETACELRRLIQRALPDADENVYGGLKVANVLYSIGRDTNVICGIQPADTHCKLYLHHVKPGDVAGVKVEGSGKNARHVKVAGLAAAQAPEIRSVLERARQGAQ